MGAMQMFDSVRSAIVSAFGGDRQSLLGAHHTRLNPQMALAYYLSSGMLRKVINIPAHDRAREWRDWQADEAQIKALEGEERRLGLQAKVKQAEVLRGLGGGAIILAVAGDPALPISKSIGKGGLVAANVVSRWQLSLKDIVKDLTSPDYGMPRYFEVNDGALQTRIHPSRVVCFRGEALPAGAGVTDDELFWGSSRLEQVLREVLSSDEAYQDFGRLIKKAKLTRVGIPNLTDFTATDNGQRALDSRIATMVLGESSMNATLYESGAAEKAETITDYQVTWTGIPEIMAAFDQRVAAVADIPYTRLMGMSPAGMNATGEHDQENWNRMVVAGQKLEVRPCLDQIDAALIPSAGVAPDAVTWRFAPLDTPSEAEEAATFDKLMDGVTKLEALNVIPHIALTKAVQNLMSENETLPGLDQALAELSEDERFGLNAEPDNTDPSALTQEGGDPNLAGAGGDGSVPRRRAANDSATGIAEGDWAEFDSDWQTEKGPSSGKVIKIEGDQVTIAHSDDPGEVFSISALKVKLRTEHYRGGTLWIFDARPA